MFSKRSFYLSDQEPETKKIAAVKTLHIKSDEVLMKRMEQLILRFLQLLVPGWGRRDGEGGLLQKTLLFFRTSRYFLLSLSLSLSLSLLFLATSTQGNLIRSSNKMHPSLKNNQSVFSSKISSARVLIVRAPFLLNVKTNIAITRSRSWGFWSGRPTLVRAFCKFLQRGSLHLKGRSNLGNCEVDNFFRKVAKIEKNLSSQTFSRN